MFLGGGWTGGYHSVVLAFYSPEHVASVMRAQNDCLAREHFADVNINCHIARIDHIYNMSLGVRAMCYCNIYRINIAKFACIYMATHAINACHAITIIIFNISFI